MSQTIQLIAFAGSRRIGSGTPLEVALVIKDILLAEPDAQVLVFELESGRQTEVDLRGTDAEIQARLRLQFGDTHSAQAGDTHRVQAVQAGDTHEEGPTSKPGKGRPRLGVVAREVTLLPRHWEWLSSRPGGASVMLRKLVEQAMRNPDAAELQRQRREAAYRFMHAMAGNEPGFEEASRALFAGNDNALRTLASGWPTDVQLQILSMLGLEPFGGQG